MSRRRILVIEDSETVRRLLRDALEQEYDVVEAPDGLKGWLLASAHPYPDLVITDVEMPRMNGISLVKRLHANAATSHIPVILLTSRDRNVDVVHGIQTGARLYLTKPFHPDDVRIKVSRVLGDTDTE